MPDTKSLESIDGAMNATVVKNQKLTMVVRGVEEHHSEEAFKTETVGLEEVSVVDLALIGVDRCEAQVEVIDPLVETVKDHINFFY